MSPTALRGSFFRFLAETPVRQKRHSNMQRVSHKKSTDNNPPPSSHCCYSTVGPAAQKIVARKNSSRDMGSNCPTCQRNRNSNRPARRQRRWHKEPAMHSTFKQSTCSNHCTSNRKKTTHILHMPFLWWHGRGHHLDWPDRSPTYVRQ